MIVSQFGVESWMDQYEEGAKYNITDTCAKPLSLAELFSLAGEDRTDFMDRFFEREQTYGTIFGSEKVKKEISRLYTSIRPEEILTEHGATGGNQHIFFSLIRPGDRVIAFSPSYQQFYSAPEALGAEVTVLRLRRENGYLPDLDELSQAAARGVRMICLNNPNNPTGDLLPCAFIEEVLKAADNIVFVDEAYMEFAQKESVIDLIDTYPNLIVLRTLSKAFALAGMRCGYLAADEALIEAIAKIKAPYNLNAFTQLFAPIVIRHREDIFKVRDAICVERDRLYAAMKEIPGVTVYPSCTNFLLVQVDKKQEEIFEALRRKDILVKIYRNSQDIPNGFRISVTTKDVDDVLISVFREALA